MAPVRHYPQPDSRNPLLQKASLVANLAGWHGGIAFKPWYKWLSPDEILLRGDGSKQAGFDGPEKGMGEEGMLYRLPVRAGADEKILLAQQKPVALSEIVRRTQEYGEAYDPHIQISPDGQWLLYCAWRSTTQWKGIRDSNGSKVFREYFWCAITVDGKQHIAWPMKMRPVKGAGRQTRALVMGLSNAHWLPDSSGIVETDVDYGEDGHSAQVIGQMRLLESSSSDRPLPVVRLEKTGSSSVWPVRMTTLSSGRTIALQRFCQTQYGDPHLKQGGTLRKLPPDRVIIYQWDWQQDSTASPPVQVETITMPSNYTLHDTSISQKGDRIVWMLIDRAHHVVISSGMTLHPSHGDGELSLWVSGIQGSAGIQKIGHITIPLGEEMNYHQAFGLGDWLPGDQRISFQFGSRLYTIPVP